MTPEQAAKYIAGQGTLCPYCKSPDITGDHVEVDAGHATQEVTCDNCHAEWRDVYTLTHIE